MKKHLATILLLLVQPLWAEVAAQAHSHLKGAWGILDPLCPEARTHLTTVKAGRQVGGWLNGKQVPGHLPNLGGVRPNFLIGAAAPNRGPFSGRVAEVRCHRFIIE